MARLEKSRSAPIVLLALGLAPAVAAQLTPVKQSDGVIRWEKARAAAEPPSWWQGLYDLFQWKSSRRPFERSVAFLAGVSDYKNLEDLTWVKTDLDKVRDYLLKQGGFDVVYEAREGVVTTNLIENYMVNRLRKEVTAQDRLLFYFSGHGTDIGGATGYLQFAGADKEYDSNQYLAVTRTEEWSRLNPAKHMLFLLDSCVSGLGFAPKEGGSANADTDLLNTFSGSGSRHVITAGTAREKAFQVTVARDQGHSVFTQAFLDALASGAQVSTDRGFVILDEVYAGLKIRVGRFTSQGSGRTMTPKLWPIPRVEKDKGTFVFLNPAAKRPQAPEEWKKELAVVPKDAEPGASPGGDVRLNMAMLAYESLKGSTNRAALERFVREYESVPGAGWMVEVFKERIRSLEAGAAVPRVTEPRPGEMRMNPGDGQPYVWIPAGEFEMGCSPGDKECDDDESPRHKVRITRGFWLGQTEVTVGAYKRFAAKAGTSMPGEAVIGARKLNPQWSDLEQPMVAVTWAEAKSYCESWAKGRLPTEAEWEYAARAGAPGSRYGDLDAIAWYADNSGNQRLDSTRAWKEDAASYGEILEKNGNRIQRVKQKQPNPWSLYDMLGNVWEWVGDWYQEDYYRKLASPAVDPKGPPSETMRVLRGGSWVNDPWNVRALCRYGVAPENRLNGLGFRCAREVIP